MKPILLLLLSPPSWSIAILVLAFNEFKIDALSVPSPPRIILRVCTSPGCRDDGAMSTLDRLLALAPPGVDVVGGACVSLCGSGPVVEVIRDDVAPSSSSSSSSMKKKRVKGGEAVSSLLDEIVATAAIAVAEEGTTAPLEPRMRDRLAGGYELSIEANAAYESREYELAINSYADAIESGRKPAVLLQQAREEAARGVGGGTGATSDDDDDDVDGGGGGYPAGLRWLVDSLKNSCRSRLSLRDVDGARRDAFAATVFSRNSDPDAHECLAEVCAASNDALGEMQGLKSASRLYDRVEREYSVPTPGSDAPTRADAARRRAHAAARRRELGFRIAKLERVLRGMTREA
ncbi:hypothetical protein ACHAW5_004567 [Stephanodiscus triporus]|uniref:Uncharacterized protein n=1 Tax=Stephanodiscus triporus TaxID=2934178 RepID=A0ABD3NXA8_9STRA